MSIRDANIPWACLIAFIALVGIELGLRAAVPPDEFPVRKDKRESVAFLRVLEADGAAEVALVGASLIERGLVLPKISELLNERTGREIHVANYGHPLAQAEFVEDLVHALMARKSAPRVVLYGVSPMQLNRNLEPDKTSSLWRAGDLHRKWEHHGGSLLGELSQVIHNELTLRFRIVQLRHERSAWVRRIVDGKPFPRTGLRGGHYHITSSSRMTLTERPPTLKTQGYLSMKRRMQESIIEGQWVHSRPLLAHMKEVGHLCRENQAELVYFEIPFHQTLGSLLAPNTYPDFYDIMAEVSSETGYPFVPFHDLGVSLTDDHYADGAHLNLKGARAMTGPVTRRLLLPALKRRFQSSPPPEESH